MEFLKLLKLNALLLFNFLTEEHNLMLVKDSNANEKAIAGGIAGAKHIHTLAEAWSSTILHTDHCAKNFTLD
jgi:fructose-bisphosphate aldolase class II